MLRSLRYVLCCMAMSCLGLTAVAGEEQMFYTGVDANYARTLAANGKAWKQDGKPIELFQALHQSGADSFRVRVWTKQDGPSGLDYALATAKAAQAAGLKPYLVFFLSDNWADYVKQPVPAAWSALPLPEKLQQVSRYCEETARAFQQARVSTEIYEIGNEIDFGICGEYEEDWGKRFNLEYMKGQVWPRAARVIAAAEAGIVKVNPKAKFLLHLTQWWNPEYCTAFAEAMHAGKERIDLFGLSFYSSSGLCKQNTFTELGASVEKIAVGAHCPLIICEYAYPSLPTFTGQFAIWNKAVDGYPLDEAGQAKWLADFLAFCRCHQQIRGAFYWSPEWYTEEMWPAFALFRPDGEAKPALRAFSATAGGRQ